MLTQLLQWSDGKKTYIFLLLEMGYRIALHHGWIQSMPDIETAILAGAGLSLRDGIKKAEPNKP